MLIVIADYIHCCTVCTFQLSYFPYQLVKVRNLTTLKLANNQITRLPFAVRRMKRLRHLILSGNKIQSLPNMLTRLVLDTLDVSGQKMFSNQLKLYSVNSAHSGLDPVTTMRQPANLWQLAARVVNSKW